MVLQDPISGGYIDGYSFIMPDREKLQIHESPKNSGQLDVGKFPIAQISEHCYLDIRRVLLADFS